MKIIFAGTPEFAVPSLEAIVKEGFEVAAVITAPDKPSGRGLKMQASPVKKFAMQHGLTLMQPLNLKDERFLNEVKNLKPDVMAVVAFRMMPEALWRIPSKGTFNLHASLLPQYRGAAPIQWAIINGETETGLTTFFINEVIDTGEIILQRKMEIGPEETAGELHDRMKTEGAALIIKTLRLIESGKVQTLSQKADGPLKPAPKIFKTHCRINWQQPACKNFNLIRGLCPHPAAFFELIHPDNRVEKIKVFRSQIVQNPATLAGMVETDGKSYFQVSCSDAWLALTEVQPEGKNRMSVSAWLNGLRHSSGLRVKY
jgi:methionyl-tRNA formyltransferase